MNTNPDLESIFSQAVALVEPGSRSEFLEQACEGNVRLRDRIGRLLDANQRVQSFMDEPAGILDLPDEPIVGEQPGDFVGNYKLLQLIGEGGMGSVFMAEQEQPVRRKVALKIVKPGLDTKEVIARFESERQALAMMSHPNIARVLDAGATDQGRPYFAMELVKGVPVTEYCNQTKMTTRERLELFVPICQAIQHAHQKGVIHRDIKPRNVMVTLIDGKPVPKVIDFGIAKAIDHRLTERTLFTRYGEFIGTPAYMSPEQAALSGMDVDTRSDVYSLGALLYELLTGLPPFDSERLKTMAHDEMRRYISESTPVQPSDAIGTAGGDQATTIAEARQSTPRDLKLQFHGELDWIVMRSLEKERARRYDTAIALAEDVQRYLQHEAVVARPQSSFYRLRKFVARNQLAVGAAAAIAVVLLVSTIVSSLLAWRAIESGRRATVEAESLREVVEFINFGLFAQANPLEEAHRDVTLRTVLDRAAHQLAAGPIERPEVEMAIRSTIGETYRGLGELDLAMLHLRRAHKLAVDNLGEADRKTISAANDLASAMLGLARYESARPLLESNLAIAERELTADDGLLLTAMKLRARHHAATGDLLAAEALLEDVLQRRRDAGGENSPETLAAMGDLGSLFQSQGRLDDALELLEVAHRGLVVTEGTWHPATLATSLKLAALYLSRNEHDRAEKVYADTILHAKNVLGEQHPQTLSAKHGLALVHFSRNRIEAAQQLLEEVLTGQSAQLGDGHPATLDTMHNLARLLKVRGQYAEAEELMVTELQRRRNTQGDADAATRRAQSELAFFYLERSRLDDAIRHFEEITETLATSDPHDPNAFVSLTMLALCRNKDGNYEAAKADLLRVEQFCAESLPDHWLQAVAASLLGEVELRLGDRKAAEDALLRGYEGLKRHEDEVPANWRPMSLRAATRRLVEFYEAEDSVERRKLAEGFREEMDRIRNPNLIRNHGQTGNNQDGDIN